MPWPQTGETQYQAQLELPDKGRAIKGLVVCNNCDLEPLDLINDPAGNRGSAGAPMKFKTFLYHLVVLYIKIIFLYQNSGRIGE